MLILAAPGREAGRYVTRAELHVFLLIVGGSVLLSIAVLLSPLIEGEYTAPIASLDLIILLAYTFSDNGFIAYSPVSFLFGLR